MNSPTPIKRFQVFGERNCGTNYIASLLTNNVENLHFVVGEREFGWKHGNLGQPWKWFNRFERMVVDPTASLDSSDDVLFIVMWRELFSWLEAMHRRPHHAPDHFELDFSRFIRLPWRAYYGRPGEDFAADTIREHMKKRPDALFEDYADILALRKAKTLMHRRFADRVANVVFINLETLQARPRDVVRSIAKVFGLQLREGFKNVMHEKHSTDLYQAPPRQAISLPDVLSIMQRIDWSTEARIGYSRPRFSAILRDSLRRPWLEVTEAIWSLSPDAETIRGVCDRQNFLVDLGNDNSGMHSKTVADLPQTALPSRQTQNQ